MTHHTPSRESLRNEAQPSTLRRLLNTALRARNPKRRRGAIARLELLDRAGMLADLDPKPAATMADRMRRDAADAAFEAARARRNSGRADVGQR